MLFMSSNKNVITPLELNTEIKKLEWSEWPKLAYGFQCDQNSPI